MRPRTSVSILILLALLVVPLLEIAVFIEVGDRIGLGATLAVVVLTAIAGTALLRQQGLRTLRRAQASLQRNELPLAEVFDGLCLLVAGALLLTPGFVTDAFGTLLFVPAVRTGLLYLMGRRILASGEVWIDGRRVEPGDGPATGSDESSGEGSEEGGVIEGDYREVDEPDRGQLPRPGNRWGRSS